MVFGAVGTILVVFGLLEMGYASWLLRFNKLGLKPREKEPKIAVLIPARDESRVIAGLLESLERQTVKLNPKDIYVIVEKLGDPTVEICGRFGCSVILRENLENQRKGFALDEAVRQILPKRYDMYFVFDADNVAAKDYLERMVETYRQGYEMATGYRLAKNANDNVIATVSSLTFSMINVLGNRQRIRHNANVIFSGTGCFVSGDLVEKWQGWPFHCLTEDYEMSLYAILEGIPTFYNEKAVFRDEQPTHYRQTVLQRIRWIKGYFEARSLYVPKLRKVKGAENIGSVKREIIGVKPLIVVLAGLVLVILSGVVWSFTTTVALAVIGIIAGVVYLALMLVTVILLKRERLELRPKIVAETILFNPIIC